MTNNYTPSAADIEEAEKEYPDPSWEGKSTGVYIREMEMVKEKRAAYLAGCAYKDAQLRPLLKRGGKLLSDQCDDVNQLIDEALAKEEKHAQEMARAVGLVKRQSEVYRTFASDMCLLERQLNDDMAKWLDEQKRVER